MPNVDVIFGNVTDMAIFAKTEGPAAGESAILSQAPLLLGSGCNGERW